MKNKKFIILLLVVLFSAKAFSFELGVTGIGLGGGAAFPFGEKDVGDEKIVKTVIGIPTFPLGVVLMMPHSYGNSSFGGVLEVGIRNIFFPQISYAFNYTFTPKQYLKISPFWGIGGVSFLFSNVFGATIFGGIGFRHQIKSCDFYWDLRTHMNVLGNDTDSLGALGAESNIGIIWKFGNKE